MKKILLLLFAAIVIMLSGCVKDIDKYGISDTTILKGRVVDKTNYEPIKDVYVGVTNGKRTHCSCTTGDDGSFALEVDFRKIDDGYFLILKGQGKRNSYKLTGIGEKEYDYQDVELITLKSFVYGSTRYEVLPYDVSEKTWDKARSYCENLVAAGRTDWILPDRSEAIAMYDNRNQIGGFRPINYWYADENSYIYFGSSSYGYSYCATCECASRPIRVAGAAY